jgi:hypothetical protein
MSTSSQMLKTLLCLLACLAIGSAAYAADDADNNRLDDAWEDAIGDQEPVLTDTQFALLNNLAFQAAVPKICDGFNIDQAKFADGMAAATSPAPNPDMSDEDAKAWEAAVLVRFGATYGLFLAEGNAKPEGFCTSAKELKADTDVPNVWQ